MTNIQEKLLSFITATEHMLELAKNAEWEQLVEIESQRRPGIEDFFKSIEPIALQQDIQVLKQTIEKILALDEQIIALATKSRSGAVDAMKKSSSARKAMSEYQSNTAI